MKNWYLIYAYAFGLSLVVSALLTALMRRVALRCGALDHPGERKMQQEPVPLLGGVAIWLTVYAVIGLNLLIAIQMRHLSLAWIHANVLAFLGPDAIMKLVGIGIGGTIIFLLGLVDDLTALKPEAKLAGQIAAALAPVLCGVRLDLFIPDILAANGWAVWIAGAATVLWIVLMTNSMNLLDNMDGLCGGISAIAAVSFFLCVFQREEYFVCLLLVVFAGSTTGFLFHNVSPARIYMGDAGAMFCGYLLATAAVLGTFYTATTPSRIAVVAPVLALSVPIFDTLSVIYIRWRSGESIMKGDKRHFSHRLVNLGMRPAHAVGFIYLVAAVTGLGAVLLGQVGLLGTCIILGQTAGVFCLIVLLMNAGNANRGTGTRL
ncbi:MAG: undecaprenyl/decaprenyl-phosphate alpha-N-acetylglucosaminyl 1-phosphate transferase [Candidatus Hydrogenedentes bacterium]|nr:undecaprenyl/decaprenyl-phosphate alpha-N-acetylglucosaminyl 1-phosphate transferase [Candidatus Hydrogenedentota bacterium]